MSSSIRTCRSAPPETSTWETPGTVSMRERTWSPTKSRIMSMSRPRGFPGRGAMYRYMKALLEKEAA